VVKGKKVNYFTPSSQKALFLYKQAQTDIQPAIAFLTRRVKSQDEHDWFKLVKMMCSLKYTHKKAMVLSADDFSVLFVMSMQLLLLTMSRKVILVLGGGAIISSSTKQEVNTQSSTEAELVAIDDIISKEVWTKLFLQAQGVTM
jgi:hypothetical protein